MNRSFVIAILAACSGTQGADVQVGSSTLVASARGALVSVHEAEGQLAAYEPGTETIHVVSVGALPARVARVGDALWVTLRGERGVAVVTETAAGALEVERTLRAGIEPYGIVYTGGLVYVASSRTGEVLELDPEGVQVVRRFAVPDEPRWLAAHPSGEAVYVGSLMRGTVSWVDLTSGEVTPLTLPETTRFTLEGVVPLTPRVTGDPAVSPEGDELAVPMLMVDHATPVEAIDPGAPPETPIPQGYGSGEGISRLNPTVVTVPLDPATGTPQGLASAQFVATTFDPFFQRPRAAGAGGAVRSYPSSVSYAGDVLLVSAEGSGALYGVYRGEADVEDSFGMAGGGGSGAFPVTPPHEAGFEVPVVRPVRAGTLPRGVLVDRGGAWVHDGHTNAVARLDTADLEDQLRRKARDFFIEEDERGLFPEIEDAVEMTPSALTPAEHRGRYLFFSATDAAMAGAGAGVSCATCHFDSRNDGLTWFIEGEPRQTPSLAGPVSHTAPVTWTSEVPTVAREAELTSSTRMGGSGLSDADSRAIAAFVDGTPWPEGERRADDPEVVQGEELFLRAGCAACHSGAAYTDNQSHEILPGVVAQTPTLRGVAASAPYFHDGSAPDLAAVLEVARRGRMGDASDLTREELRALEAFLRSL